MAKKALPIFIRDHQTGLLGELTLDESQLAAFTGNKKSPEPLLVLVADDNEAERLLTIRQISKTWPVEREIIVECAADGQEALEKIRRRQFGLVILDGNMPHQDGAEVLRAIRAEGLRVPVVVVSAQNREAITGDLKALAATFVNKQEMNPINFGSAIVESIHLQARLTSTPGG
jgi:CheY-like chemotaxis protein